MTDHAPPPPPFENARPDSAPPAPRRGGLRSRANDLDRIVSTRLVIPPRSDGVVAPWVSATRRFSEAGSYGVGWIAMFTFAAAFSDGPLPAAVAAVCIVGMLVFNTGVKSVIRRPRPMRRAIDHAPTTYSMPSAHSSMAMVGGATMSVLMPQFAALWWTVGGLLAASRVVLGMHYLGDVIAGVLLGLLVGLLVAGPLVHAAAVW